MKLLPFKILRILLLSAPSLTVFAVTTLPLILESNSAQTPPPFCKESKPLPRPLGQYPLHETSPLESLHAHDVALLVEVIVPVRRCSLGLCAGVAIKQVLKGVASLPNNLLLQIRPSQGMDCLKEDFLSEKKQLWYIFANAGTSKGGQAYFQLQADGPSFPTAGVADFAQLEQGFQRYRKDLDYAIKTTMGAKY